MILLDAHQDTVLRLSGAGAPPLRQDGSGRQSDLPKWRAGGLGAVWCAAWVDPRQYHGAAATDRALELLAEIARQVETCGGGAALADSADDVRRIATGVASGQGGDVAILRAVEGGMALAGDLANVERLRAAGATYLTLTWRGDLPWAGSDELGDGTRGLSDFGRRVVLEMNRVGMVVDLSHASDQTFFDAVAVSRRPCIASHSCCKALAGHPRNLADNQLRALRDTGGVVGVCLAMAFLRGRGLTAGWTRPSVATVADHIEHVATVAGIDHVGLGSDYDGGVRPPAGLETAAGLEALLVELRRRGWDEADLEKFASENFLRVLAANGAGA